MKLLFELLIFYGLRISEALYFDHTNITNDGLIKIKGLKGSSSRILYIRHNREYLINNYLYSLPLANIYSRFYVYRLFKKLGIYQRFNINSHFSVTHYFRHNLVKHLKDNGYDNKTITNFMGWNSEKTILFYI